MAVFSSPMDEFPTARDHIGAGWVTRCIRRAGYSTAEVGRIAIEDIPELGQTADGFIVHLDYDDQPDGAPDTLFAKVSPRDDRHRLQVHDLGLYARELSFYLSLIHI